jgi:aromatic amino acid aminotransferase I
LPSRSTYVTPLDIEERVYTKARENGVLLSKGSWFAVDEGLSSVHLRMTFAAAPHDALAKAVEIFAKTLREEFMLVEGIGEKSLEC